jgi:hypothetical protein
MDQRFFPAIAAEFQGLALPEDRACRAGETALAIQDRIALAALAQLAFDDSPYDYAAMLVQAARRVPETK